MSHMQVILARISQLSKLDYHIIGRPYERTYTNTLIYVNHVLSTKVTFKRPHKTTKQPKAAVIHKRS